ncbi:MAG: NUDIX hydrolase [Mesorhizobium sp.]|nr:MAG: NUDIX hydrolase [Mesorhizobium sp.]
MTHLLEEDQAFCRSINDLRCEQVGNFQFPEDCEKARRDNWDALVNRRPEMFDGRLLRLKSIDVGGQIEFRCEATNFSSYILSRNPSFTTRFPRSERANPIGLTLLVATADDQVLVTQRSLQAEQNPGGLYFVGGFAEPLADDGAVDLFGEATRELVEEIALVEICRDQSLCIGLGYDPSFCHPELFFLVKTEIAADVVIANGARARDRHEATRIISVPMGEFLGGEATIYRNAPLTWSFKKGPGVPGAAQS